MKNYMLVALEEAYKSFDNEEVPVGAVLVKNNEIIAKSGNIREKNHNLLGHAEILCIQKASEIEKTWKFDGYDLYITLEPCKMCLEVIKQARISNVYYLIKKQNNKQEFYKTNIQKIDIDNFAVSKYIEKLADFFKKFR